MLSGHPGTPGEGGRGCQGERSAGGIRAKPLRYGRLDDPPESWRELWAVAVHDFGLTSEEFGRLTPGMFMALLDRRSAQFRRECYLAGLVASTILNVNRHSEKDRAWSPFDFVPTLQEDPERDQIKQNIASLFSMLSGADPSHL